MQHPKEEEMEILGPRSHPNQAMEARAVGQAERVSKAEKENEDEAIIEDPPTSKFTWTIQHLSRVNLKKYYSDIFTVGGFKWRILMFPKGNNVDRLSMYLDVADATSLPYGWTRYAHFSLAVVNQIHSKYTVRKETQHNFTAWESDWGFTSFMPLLDLYDPAKGYLIHDTLIVEAEVTVQKSLDYWGYDSKKETGFVGLKNQGATCYMNSLLQTLYHMPYFRKAVYHMPTTENDVPSNSIPLALQSVFYRLQYNDTSVSTKDLTKSFGWDTYDSFLQHDVQELNRVLSEKLEDKMKGTVVEGTIQQLFEGHHMNYIECINVDYKSTRKESFYDLQLDVKGCQDVYASFDKYVEVERLEGDNKYHAEHYGLQEARKGVLFIDFPPVLQLQLKRFEYDFMRDTMVKINDRYEFPLELDLDRENGKYLSPDADRSVNNLYILHSVLVHSGGVHGGHYYAFIRPTLSDQWFKFDDERVTKEETKRALEEQYGGEEELLQSNPGFNNTPFKFTKFSNAYMLVYVRKSDKDNIICNVDEKDIAEHLRVRLKKEQDDKLHKRKEKAEAHLYTIIKVARDVDLTNQIGKDIYFDLVDHDRVRTFRIQKQIAFIAFKEDVAKAELEVYRDMVIVMKHLPLVPSFTPMESVKIKYREFSQLASFENRRHQGQRSPKLARISPFKFHCTAPIASQNLAAIIETERIIFDSKSEPPPIFDGNIRLYISQMCPYAQRVWIARNYKELVDIRVVEISLSDKPLWYKEVYPTGKVPALEHNGKVIGESLDLLEYLDLNFGGPKIFPLDPEKKKIASDLMKHSDSFIKAGFSALSMKDATPIKIEQNFGPALDQLETSIQKFSNTSPFFLGEFGVVDIAYVPFIERLRLAFSHLKNYDITHGRPMLARWIEAMDGIDAYARTKAEPSTIIEIYKRMLASDYFVKIGIATIKDDNKSM